MCLCEARTGDGDRCDNCARGGRCAERDAVSDIKCSPGKEQRQDLISCWHAAAHSTPGLARAGHRRGVAGKSKCPLPVYSSPSSMYTSSLIRGVLLHSTKFRRVDEVSLLSLSAHSGPSVHLQNQYLHLVTSDCSPLLASRPSMSPHWHCRRHSSK